MLPAVCDPLLRHAPAGRARSGWRVLWALAISSSGWIALSAASDLLAAEQPATLNSTVEQSAAETSSPESAGIEFFERHIRPVLIERCYECHSASATPLQGGLRLDSRPATRGGGDSGPAVIPGDVAASHLISALKYDGLEMPPSGRLAPEVVANFVKWVEMGAPDPRDDAPESLTPGPTKEMDWQTAHTFWAFRPPERHTPPTLQQPQRARTPIDAFVLAKLEAAGLSPNEPADARTLLRRMSFDLTGLPPTPEETAAFETAFAAEPDSAVAAAADRLLNSPHYGERWATLWLDVMRYAEDQAHIVGGNKELFYPNAYLYRDWVIEAFNSDLPYDEFIRLQLAADLFSPDDSTAQVALGFLGLGPKYYRRGSPEVQAEEWENHVDTLARGLLGLTVACARCHDHKFDPITTEDYYALAGVFASIEMFNRPLDDERKVGKNGNAENPEEALHVVRDKEPRDLHVMIRGDVNRKGPEVHRGFLQVLCEGDRRQFTSGSGRRELAEAITDPHNPLTARVIVNRIWGQFFGRPLVGTPSNFGTLGEAPTHLELLDDLAARFMEQGWSLRWLQREIVLSAVYRQSSRIETGAQAVDPSNVLLWRMPRRRLSIEQWRDALLAVSGRLDPQIGGKSIDPADPQATRRTVYAERSRLELNSLLKTFDFADPNAHSERRVETNTPLQKLLALNHPLMVRQAETLVERVHREAGPSIEAGIRRMYALLYSREPDRDELAAGAAFLGEPADERNWVEYAQVLLASNELLFVD